jgi:hypothetical protein
MTQTSYRRGGHLRGARPRSRGARGLIRSRRSAPDLPAIVAMLADDFLRATRENPADMAPYERAFALLAADPRNLLLVGEDAAATVVASLSSPSSRPSATVVERALISGSASPLTCAARGSGTSCCTGRSAGAAAEAVR